MSNRLSPANLVARSVASARSLATSVPPPPDRGRYFIWDFPN